MQVVDPLAQTRTEQVFFGATVTVEDQDGVEHVYRIVGQDEVDGGAGEISWKSPVGRALLGKSLGDSVVVQMARRHARADGGGHRLRGGATAPVHAHLSATDAGSRPS